MEKKKSRISIISKAKRVIVITILWVNFYYKAIKNKTVLPNVQQLIERHQEDAHSHFNHLAMFDSEADVEDFVCNNTCSAPHFHARMRIRKSSGLNSRSLHNASMPEVKTASSALLKSLSRYFSKSAAILPSEPCLLSLLPDRPNGGIRLTKVFLKFGCKDH